MDNKLVLKQETQCRGLKLRIYPTTEQEILINKTFGCARKVYNQRIAEKQNIKDYHLFGEQGRNGKNSDSLADSKLSGWVVATKWKVLIIDMDFNNLGTSYYYMDENLFPQTGQRNIADALSREMNDLCDYIPCPPWSVSMT
jgi:hypothetical protein